MELKTENHFRSKKELSKEAISLALSGDWERAAEVNQAILDQTPDDVESMNRLGKALMEVGEYGGARDVLVRVVRAAPYNNIAKRTWHGWSRWKVRPRPQGRSEKQLEPRNFLLRRAASQAQRSYKS